MLLVLFLFFFFCDEWNYQCAVCTQSLQTSVLFAPQAPTKLLSPCWQRQCSCASSPQYCLHCCLNTYSNSISHHHQSNHIVHCICIYSYYSLHTYQYESQSPNNITNDHHHLVHCIPQLVTNHCCTVSERRITSLTCGDTLIVSTKSESEMGQCSSNVIAF